MQKLSVIRFFLPLKQQGPLCKFSLCQILLYFYAKRPIKKLKTLWNKPTTILLFHSSVSLLSRYLFHVSPPYGDNSLDFGLYELFDFGYVFGIWKCESVFRVRQMSKKLPWYGRRNRQRKVEAEVQSGQQSRRLEHISVEVASHVWIKSFELLSYNHSHEFFHWRKKNQ